MKWPHGMEELNRLIEHLNNQSDSIKFIMKRDKDGTLQFLDVLVIRNTNGSIAHKVYRKKMHTDQYLYAKSHYHLSQKMGVSNTLITRTIRISDKDHLEQEKGHLCKVF